MHLHMTHFPFAVASAQNILSGSAHWAALSNERGQHDAAVISGNREPFLPRCVSGRSLSTTPEGPQPASLRQSLLLQVQSSVSHCSKPHLGSGCKQPAFGFRRALNPGARLHLRCLANGDALRDCYGQSSTYFGRERLCQANFIVW